MVGCCCAETACLWPTSCSPIQLSHFTGLSAALTSISTEMSSDKPYAEEAWDVFVGYRAHMEREWDLSPSVLMSGHMHSYDNESITHSERGSDWNSFIMVETWEDFTRALPSESKIPLAYRCRPASRRTQYHCGHSRRSREGSRPRGTLDGARCRARWGLHCRRHHG